MKRGHLKKAYGLQRQTRCRTPIKRLLAKCLLQNIYTGDDVDLLNKKPKLKREFGGLKGFVTYMSDDFDAPLDDFKDYM